MRDARTEELITVFEDFGSEEAPIGERGRGNHPHAEPLAADPPRDGRERAIAPRVPLRVGAGGDAKRQEVCDEHHEQREAEGAREGGARRLDLAGECARRVEAREAPVEDREHAAEVRVLWRAQQVGRAHLRQADDDERRIRREHEEGEECDDAANELRRERIGQREAEEDEQLDAVLARARRIAGHAAEHVAAVLGANVVPDAREELARRRVEQHRIERRVDDAAEEGPVALLHRPEVAKGRLHPQRVAAIVGKGRRELGRDHRLRHREEQHEGDHRREADDWACRGDDALRAERAARHVEEDE